MKSTTARDKSSIASFIDGLNSTAPLKRAPLNAVGRTARALKQVFALALVVLIVPMTTGTILGESAAPQDQQGQYQGVPPPPPTQQDSDMNSGQGAPPPDQGAPQDQGAPPEQGGPQIEGAPQGQPMSADELGRLVAPIALYPDALVAQVLAASTYPSEVVEADRWVQAQGNIPAEQLAAQANAQSWDPSVKALVAFPSVLAQMDRNIQWTTDLGNAYYNQPEDVMAAVQTMRGRAQAAGTLHNTPQQVVEDNGGAIEIQPANPEVVYVPSYDPWAVYGAPIGVFPGYYYGPPAGVYFGSGLAIGFGIGIGIGVYSGWGWGYHHWHPDWRGRTIVYNHNRYMTRSRTVYNRGWNRPGGPHGYDRGRGAYNRGGYRGGQGFNRSGNYNRGGQNFNRGGQNFNRGSRDINHGGIVNSGGGIVRSGGGVVNSVGGVANHGGQNFNRGGQSHFQGGNRGGGQIHSAGRTSGGGGHMGGGGHGGGHGH